MRERHLTPGRGEQHVFNAPDAAIVSEFFHGPKWPVCKNRRGSLSVDGRKPFSFHGERIRLRNRLIVFLSVFQTVLLLVHGFLFFTWIYFWAPRMAGQTDYGDLHVSDHPTLLVAMAICSVSFLITSLIGFRLTNMVLRCVYRITAVWLGFVNYAFFSAVACWVSYVALRLIRGAPPERDYFALGFLGWPWR